MMGMAEFFYNTCLLFEQGLGFGGMSAVCMAISFLVFVAYFVFWLVKRRLTIKHYACFLVFTLSIVIFQGAIELVFMNKTLAVITLSFLGVLCGILMCLPNKSKIKQTDAPIQFARFIDGQVKQEQREKELPQRVESEHVVLKEMARPKDPTPEVDFSHVKSVIKRLEYYNLTPSDKRQVTELERSIFTAERNGITPEIKESVNDGLGALLKIMSKYGV